jgi:hypothetical protein
MDALRTIAIALLSGLGGYIAGVPLGMYLVHTFTPYRHDRVQHAALTGVYVIGPLAALVAGFAAAEIISHVRRSF